MTPTNQTMGILYAPIIFPPKVKPNVYLFKGITAKCSREKALLFFYLFFLNWPTFYFYTYLK